jgi:Mg2+ and Co2+ transporter CorA
MSDNKTTRIPPVADNYEKRDTYQRNMQRFNKARRDEYYLEALWILYAMIEDLTTSFFYYIGFVSEKNRSSVAKRVKNDVRDILEMPTGKNKYGLNNISGKLDAIAKVLSWAQTTEKSIGYQGDLKALVTGKVKFQLLYDALKDLDEWRDIRNELVHALFNKKYDEVEPRLAEMVDRGYKAMRVLDNSIKAIKRGTNIRKRHKIQ